MRKEKKYSIYLILLAILGLTYIIIQGAEAQKTRVKEEEEEQVETADKVIKREKEVWDAIKKILDTHTIEGINAIDVIEGDMEVDQYNRYLATFQVLGVDKTEEIKLYDYYMVVQEDSKGELYTMPFGIEIVPSHQNDMKKDITRSIVKIANGWGKAEVEFKEKWTNKVKSGNETIAKENDAYMQRIYDAQQIISFMSKYIKDWLQVIEEGDRTLVDQYYEENSPIQDVHYERLKKIRDEGMTIEVYELEILDVMCLEAKGVFEVTIEGNMQTYSKEKIRVINQKSIYTLKEKDGTFVVLNEEVIKKE